MCVWGGGGGGGGGRKSITEREREREREKFCISILSNGKCILSLVTYLNCCSSES